jgi:hypothetical protein
MAQNLDGDALAALRKGFSDVLHLHHPIRPLAAA